MRPASPRVRALSGVAIAAIALAALAALPRDGAAQNGADVFTLRIPEVGGDTAPSNVLIPRTWDGSPVSCFAFGGGCINEGNCPDHDEHGNPYPQHDPVRNTIYGAFPLPVQNVGAANARVIVDYADASGEETFTTFTPALPRHAPPGGPFLVQSIVPENAEINDDTVITFCFEPDPTPAPLLEVEVIELSLSGVTTYSLDVVHQGGPATTANEVWTFSDNPLGDQGLGGSSWANAGNPMGGSVGSDFSATLNVANAGPGVPSLLVSGIPVQNVGGGNEIIVEFTNVFTNNGRPEAAGRAWSPQTVQDPTFDIVIDGLGTFPFVLPHTLYGGEWSHFSVVFPENFNFGIDDVNATNVSATGVNQLSGTGVLVAAPPTFIVNLQTDQAQVASYIYNSSANPIALDGVQFSYPFVNQSDPADPILLGYANATSSGSILPGSSRLVTAAVPDPGTSVLGQSHVFANSGVVSWGNYSAVVSSDTPIAAVVNTGFWGVPSIAQTGP